MKIVAILPLALVLGATSASAAKPATLEMRLVVDCAPGAVPLPYDNQGSREDLCLSGDLILDRSNIVDAREIHTVYGTDAIQIAIDAKAVSRLTAATNAHVGGRFGVVFDGKLVSAPVVREAITGNELEISFGPGFDDLAAVAEALRGEDTP